MRCEKSVDFRKASRLARLRGPEMEIDRSSDVGTHGNSPNEKPQAGGLRLVERIEGNALPLLISIYTRPIAVPRILGVKRLKLKGKYSWKVWERVFGRGRFRGDSGHEAVGRVDRAFGYCPGVARRCIPLAGRATARRARDRLVGSAQVERIIKGQIGAVRTLAFAWERDFRQGWCITRPD